MDPSTEKSDDVSFGRFRLSPHRRELFADGVPLKLGGRAFDVLLALIEARGAVVDKAALIERVWPGRIVEENSLQAQISALRTAFAEDRELIRTVAGHGYQFTGQLRVVPLDQGDGAIMPTGGARPGMPPTNLPETVSELIGRDSEQRAIQSLAADHRLVTLTGAGGIGKTRLALAVARRLLPEFADGVWLIALAPVSDPGLVPASVAATMGVDLGAGVVSAERVANALCGKRFLLVLDNCEHVIDAAASIVEALLLSSSGVHLIVTSQEPLNAEGEWVYPVPPLAVPHEDMDDDQDPLRYGAVQLFIERARATEPRFAPNRLAMETIAGICQRLDGIPLAIELAAARIATLGLDELAARLDDRFQFLTGGRRTGLPRHRTLRATLDWSYELLSEPERLVLQRLAVFAGIFSLEAASAVVADPAIPSEDVLGCLSNLVSKSLVVMEVEETTALYRLLETTRIYAFEKLVESPDREQLLRRHAEYYRDLFEQVETEWETRPSAELLADYGRKIDNVRAALDWALSPAGDASVGAALTAAAVPLWSHLSLIEECRTRVERALAAIEMAAERNTRCEMKLHAALASSFTVIRMANPADMEGHWTRALELAESLADVNYQMRALEGLSSFHSIRGQPRVALLLAQRFSALAAKQPDQNDQQRAALTMGMSQFHMGDPFAASVHFERVFAHDITQGRRPVHVHLDVRGVAGCYLAWAHWLQGFPDKAKCTAERCIEEVRTTNHILTLCYVLATGGCAIAARVGDDEACEHYAAELLDYATRYGLMRWRVWASSHQGALAIKRGDTIRGLQLLRDGAAGMHKNWLATLRAEALGRAAQIAEGLATAEAAIEDCERNEEWSVIVDLLRVKGELLLLQGAEASAEDHFRQALDWARRQGALSAELLAATSLARLLRNQGRTADGIALLQPVYDRFTEGFDTADLRSAKALLAGLG